MQKSSIPNINKNNLSKNISSKIGVPDKYSEIIINDLIDILINFLKIMNY